jgi:hypothetical protein
LLLFIDLVSFSTNHQYRYNSIAPKLSACVFSGIGIIITSNADQGSAYFLSVATLQALAGGTIIYVVVFEVLERERSKNVSGLAQLFFVILGFCVMMSVEILGKVLNIIILF